MKFPSFYVPPPEDESGWDLSGPSSSARPLLSVHKTRATRQKPLFKRIFEFWKRLPYLLNRLRYNQYFSQSNDVLDYEPIHLHVSMQRGIHFSSESGQPLFSSLGSPKPLMNSDVPPPGRGHADESDSPSQGKARVRDRLKGKRSDEPFQFPLEAAERVDRSPVPDNSGLHPTHVPGYEPDPAGAQHVNQSDAAHSPHEMSAENFRFLLEQVPAIRTLSFAGPPDPFLNKSILRMVNLAYKFNDAEATIICDGMNLSPWIRDILESSLSALVVNLHGHKPSEFWRLTGRPPADFVKAHTQLAELLSARQKLLDIRNTGLNIDVSFTLDVHNFQRLPEMLEVAEALGVDGVRFENYTDLESRHKTDRTLFQQQPGLVEYFKRVRKELLPQYKLHVTLPVLLDEDMHRYRNCSEPFTTVTVDSDFSIAGCPRHVPCPTPVVKIWDPDFWNSSLYQWIRHVHKAVQPSGKRRGEDLEQTPPPTICQSCPMNMPKA